MIKAVSGNGHDADGLKQEQDVLRVELLVRRTTGPVSERS
jgi:hypothetical protein